MPRSPARLWAVPVVIALIMAAIPAGAAADDPPGPHCVSLLTRLAPDVPTAEIALTTCFQTFSEAIEYVLPGQLVPEVLRGSSLRGARLKGQPVVQATASSTIIGVQWEHVRRGGRSRVYYVSESRPCGDGAVWEINQLDLGWDRMVSSAEGFGGCGRFQQWEHANQQGAVRVCLPYCSSLGDLNDQISSVRWRA